MTRDMGDWKRCIGAPSGAYSVPAPQDWQLNLPEPAADLPDFDAVRASIKDVMLEVSSLPLPRRVACARRWC
eukprot:3932893-Rhodomonas_salina.2